MEQDSYSATVYLDILLQSTPFDFNILPLLSKSPTVKLSMTCSHASPGSSWVGFSPTNCTHLRQNLRGTDGLNVSGLFYSQQHHFSNYLWNEWLKVSMSNCWDKLYASKVGAEKFLVIFQILFRFTLYHNNLTDVCECLCLIKDVMCRALLMVMARV